MSGASSIEWTDATWNPVRGCSRVSEGCRNCYAENVAARFAGPGLAFDGFAKRVGGDARWTGKVELVPAALDWPLRWRGAPAAKAEGRPSRIFVNSMSDLFHEKLDREHVMQVLAFACAAGFLRGHRFQVLTKRPERMRELVSEAFWIQVAREAEQILLHSRPELPAEECGGLTAHHPSMLFAFRQRFVPAPPWIWLGTSVEDQATADERIPHLLACPAAVRFSSYEPALGPVDFRRVQPQLMPIDSLTGSWAVPSNSDAHYRQEPRLHWLIWGGESGPGARPNDLAWGRSARDQCKAAGVAFFVKQLGRFPVCRSGPGIVTWPDRELRDRKGGDWNEWPADLRVREFPKGDA